jgi:hypothetical protein
MANATHPSKPLTRLQCGLCGHANGPDSEALQPTFSTGNYTAVTALLRGEFDHVYCDACGSELDAVPTVNVSGEGWTAACFTNEASWPNEGDSATYGREFYACPDMAALRQTVTTQLEKARTSVRGLFGDLWLPESVIHEQLYRFTPEAQVAWRVSMDGWLGNTELDLGSRKFGHLHQVGADVFLAETLFESILVAVTRVLKGEAKLESEVQRLLSPYLRHPHTLTMLTELIDTLDAKGENDDPLGTYVVVAAEALVRRV